MLLKPLTEQKATKTEYYTSGKVLKPLTGTGAVKLPEAQKVTPAPIPTIPEIKTQPTPLNKIGTFLSSVFKKATPPQVTPAIPMPQVTITEPITPITPITPIKPIITPEAAVSAQLKPEVKQKIPKQLPIEPTKIGLIDRTITSIQKTLETHPKAANWLGKIQKFTEDTPFIGINKNPLIKGIGQTQMKMLFGSSQQVQDTFDKRLTQPVTWEGKTFETVGNLIGAVSTYYYVGKYLKGIGLTKMMLPTLYATLGQTAAPPGTTPKQRAISLPIDVLTGYIFGKIPGAKGFGKEAWKAIGFKSGAVGTAAFSKALLYGKDPKEAGKIAAFAATTAGLFYIVGNATGLLTEKRISVENKIVTADDIRTRVYSNKIENTPKGQTLLNSADQLEQTNKFIELGVKQTKQSILSDLFGMKKPAISELTGAKIVDYPSQVTTTGKEVTKPTVEKTLALSPQEALTEVKTSNLTDTSFGKAIIEASARAEKIGGQVKIDASGASGTIVTTPGGNTVGIDVVSPEKPVVPPIGEKGIKQTFINTIESQLKGTSEEGQSKLFNNAKFTSKNVNTNSLTAPIDSPEVVKQWETKISAGEKPVILTTTQNGETRVADGAHKLQAYKNLEIAEVPTINADLTGVSIEVKRTHPRRNAQGQLIDMYGNKTDSIAEAMKELPPSQISPEVKEAEGKPVELLEKYYTPSTNLSPEEKIQQDKFFDQLKTNTDAEIAKYHKQFGNVINTDNVRELSSYYSDDKSKSATVHEPASAFTKVLYENALAQPDPTGKNIVLFTAGGTGAGKTSAIKNIAQAQEISDEANIIYDTNLNNFKSASEKINLALDANKTVKIFYIFSDLEKAFDQSISRAINPTSTSFGRTVPIPIHISAHVGSYETIFKLQDLYKDNPSVEIVIIDNTGGKGQSFMSSLDKIKEKDYNIDELRNKLYEKLNQKYKSGQISKKLYEGFIGRRKTPSKPIDTKPKLQRKAQPVRPTVKPVTKIEIDKTQSIKDIKSTLKSIKGEFEDLKTEAEGIAAMAQEQRAGLNVNNIAKLKRIYNRSQRFQEGDIETIRASKTGELLDKVLENVREKYPEMSEQEAFDFALALPTKTAETIRPSPKMKELLEKQKTLKKYLDLLIEKQKALTGDETLSLKELNKRNEAYDEWKAALFAQSEAERIITVPRQQIPVGEGKQKVSRLEARVKKTLDNISQETADKLGLSTFNELNKKENIAAASKYVSENPDDALKVLSGEIETPKGILRNAIYVAMQNLAIGDVDLALKLASITSTRLGQELSILTEIDTNSPVKIIKDIIGIREATIKKRYPGRSIKQIQDKIVKNIKAEVKAPGPNAWEKFISDLIC